MRHSYRHCLHIVQCCKNFLLLCKKLIGTNLYKTGWKLFALQISPTFPEFFHYFPVLKNKPNFFYTMKTSTGTIGRECKIAENLTQ